MEAGTSPFEFYQTTSLGAQVGQHFGQQILQILLIDGVESIESMEAGIGDIESCGELMGGGIGCVAVDSAESANGMRSAEKRGYADAVSCGAAGMQGVDEVISYITEESLGLRHEERERMGQGIYVVGVVGGDRYDGTTGVESIGERTDGFYPQPFGIGVMNIIGVVENLAQMPDIVDADTAVLPAQGIGRSGNPFMSRCGVRGGNDVYRSLCSDSIHGIHGGVMGIPFVWQSFESILATGSENSGDQK